MPSLRLRNRIAIIVLLHAVMITGLALAFSLPSSPRSVPPAYRLPVPEKVALVAMAFERTPPATHGDLAQAFSDSTLHVFLLPALPDQQAGAATPDAMARYRQALGGRPFRIQTARDRAPVDFDAYPKFSSSFVRICVALPDGHALAIEQTASAPVARFLYNRVLFLLVVGLVDILVILWLASQTTRPVEQLARAVREDRLEDLPPGGPHEIADLAAAFRHLRGRLRDLVHERTRMLAAIAHDYRTYLTRMELRSDFIEDDTQRALAEQDLAEMRQLLADTLTFAREAVAEDVSNAACDLRTELAALAQERQERGEEIGIAPMEGPMLVHASHVSFQRMMANLLDNAIRYGGGRATILLRSERGLVHILVEDDGPGVPEDSLDRLLEPFERLETSRARHTGGVGLGLSIVQALARRYGGTLALENRNGGGFRAILTLRGA
jgi:signal transduction histidine kinase